MIVFKLQEIMDKKGITRYQLAKDTGINYLTINKLYKGESRTIQFDILDKICTQLECTPGDLLVYTTDPAASSPKEFMKKLAESDTKEALELMDEIYRKYISEEYMQKMRKKKK